MANGRAIYDFTFAMSHLPFFSCCLLPTARGLSLSHTKPRKDNLEHSVHVSRAGECVERAQGVIEIEQQHLVRRVLLRGLGQPADGSVSGSRSGCMLGFTCHDGWGRPSSS